MNNNIVKEIVLRFCLALIFVIPLVFIFVNRLENFDLFVVKNGWGNWMIAPYLTRGIVLVLLTGALLSLFLKFKKSKIKVKWYGLALLILVSFIGLNGIEMLDQRDFKKVDSTYSYSQDIWTSFFETLFKKYPELEDEEFLLANFSVTCGHCNDFAKKISATLKGYDSSKNVVFQFWGTEQEINDFLKRNHCQNIRFIKTTKLEMFNLVGNGFPVFEVINNGVVIQEFFSRELNNFEMHNYFKTGK